jgi:RNA ligase (TIGR02306 family)
VRKLARVVKIDSVVNHPNADRLDLCKVGGWQVLSKRDLYKTGDLAIYFEIDSWIPHELDPSLTKEGHEPKVYNGVLGQRLRTVKLRGELSQGLLIPLNFGLGGLPLELVDVQEGEDLTELLGIQKWEMEIPAQLAGQTKAPFPSQFPKTDQERVQNLSTMIELYRLGAVERFYIQEKLEGSSMTCYLIDGNFGVCSRNLDLIETEGNTFWQVARELDIENKMRNLFGEQNIAIQGELIGPAIQGNIYKLAKPTMRVFDIVDTQGKLCPGMLTSYCDYMGLETVPNLGVIQTNDPEFSIEGLLKIAEGKSILNPSQEREGIVLKHYLDGNVSFKAISNRYLEKQK